MHYPQHCTRQWAHFWGMSPVEFEVGHGSVSRQQCVRPIRLHSSGVTLHRRLVLAFFKVSISLKRTETASVFRSAQSHDEEEETLLTLSFCTTASCFLCCSCSRCCCKGSAVVCSASLSLFSTVPPLDPSTWNEASVTDRSHSTRVCQTGSDTDLLELLDLILGLRVSRIQFENHFIIWTNEQRRDVNWVLGFDSDWIFFFISRASVEMSDNFMFSLLI